MTSKLNHQMCVSQFQFIVKKRLSIREMYHFTRQIPLWAATQVINALNSSRRYAASTRMRDERYGVRVPVETTPFPLLQNVQTVFGAHSSSHSIGNGVLSQGRSGRDSSALTSVKIKNDWRYTYVSPIRLSDVDTDFTFPTLARNWTP